MRGALRSPNSVLAMPARRSTKPKNTRVNSRKSGQIKIVRGLAAKATRSVTEEGSRCSMLGGFRSRGEFFCSRGLRPRP